MRIPFLWAAWSDEYPDEGSVLVWATSSYNALAAGSYLLDMAQGDAQVAPMHLSHLWGRWRMALACSSWLFILLLALPAWANLIGGI